MSAETNEVALLELCTSPSGYAFHRGLWCTHDLNGKVMTDLVVPQLLGIGSRDGSLRRREAIAAAAAAADSRLCVLYAPQRLTAGPLFPRWLKTIAMPGRLLHAKFAVLQFRRIGGKAAQTRAIVTSANLTEGGVQDNREVVLFEEVGVKHTATLCRDLLLLFKGLATEFGEENRALIEAIRKDIADGGLGQAKKCGLVHHSLSERRPLTAQLAKPRRVRRVVIVSPPFGSDDDDGPARLLKDYLGDRPEVEIYVGVNAPPALAHALAPAFSRACYEYLRKHAARVRLMAVPEQVPDEVSEGEGAAPLRTRPLHAKLLALVDGEGEAHLLAGSANFTSRGLGGRNREVMVEKKLSEDEFDGWLALLKAVEWRAAPSPSKRDEDAAVVEVLLSRMVTASFQPAVGVTCALPRWPGVLRMDWQQPPAAVIYEHRNGTREQLAVRKEQALELDATMAGLLVKVDQGWVPIRIEVVLPADELSFWTVAARDPDERPDHELWALLTDLRGHKAPPRNKELKDSLGGRGTTDEDGFHLKPEQRLVLLARLRASLNHQLDGREAAQRLEEYLHPHKDLALEARSLDVGRVILSAYLDGVEAPKSPLLQALRECMKVSP